MTDGRQRTLFANDAFLRLSGCTREALPDLAEDKRTAANKVQGCASQVWIMPRIEDGRFDFQGDSDALIVRGLIAILHALYSGVPVAEVVGIDAQVQPLQNRLGLGIADSGEIERDQWRLEL